MKNYEHDFCGLNRADPIHMFWLGLGLGFGMTMLGFAVAVMLWMVAA